MPNKEKRINIWIPQQTAERIERLRIVTQAPSMTEVIRAALFRDEILVGLLADGNKIYVCKEGETQLRQVHFLIDILTSQK